MYRPIIKEQVYSGKCLPLKTLSFVPQTINPSKNIANKNNKSYRQSTKSARAKTTGGVKNLQIVMKLSQVYTPSTEYFQTISSKIYASQTLSPQKAQAIISTKRIILKSALLKQNKRQKQSLINFNDIKYNNYKNFPKRQVKLKNNSPYKFYMFSSKSKNKYYQQQKFRQIKIQNLCTLIRDTNSPPKRRPINIQYKNLRQQKDHYLEPWNNVYEQRKDDQITF